MYCKKCGNQLNDTLICPVCGADNSKPQEEAVQTATEVTPVPSEKKLSVWCILAICSLVGALITFIMGVYKMAIYDSGDYYPYSPQNAYVGGDAYNYIINGTYATAFFVLTAMFVLAAVGLVAVHYISSSRKENSKNDL